MCHDMTVLEYLIRRESIALMSIFGGMAYLEGQGVLVLGLYTGASFQVSNSRLWVPQIE